MTSTPENQYPVEIHEKDPWRTIKVDADGTITESIPNQGDRTRIFLDRPETRRAVARALAPELSRTVSREDIKEIVEHWVDDSSQAALNAICNLLDQAGVLAPETNPALDAAVEAFRESYNPDGVTWAPELEERVQRSLQAALRVYEEQRGDRS